MSSPFLEIPIAAPVASNALAFAVRDKYPISDGHTLVVPRRLIVTLVRRDAGGARRA